MAFWPMWGQTSSSFSAETPIRFGLPAEPLYPGGPARVVSWRPLTRPTGPGVEDGCIDAADPLCNPVQRDLGKGRPPSHSDARRDDYLQLFREILRGYRGYVASVHARQSLSDIADVYCHHRHVARERLLDGIRRSFMR